MADVDIYYPCSECWEKYKRQYSEECDGYCDYAKAVKERDELEAIINSMGAPKEWKEVPFPVDILDPLIEIYKK